MRVAKMTTASKTNISHGPDSQLQLDRFCEVTAELFFWEGEAPAEPLLRLGRSLALPIQLRLGRSLALPIQQLRLGRSLALPNPFTAQTVMPDQNQGAEPFGSKTQV